MSFAFGFSGEDVEYNNDDDEYNGDKLAADMDSTTLTEPSALVPTKTHTLREMLSDLPSQLSYNTLQIQKRSSKEEALHIPRRSVFDIRTQLMAEADPEDASSDVLLSGLEHGDLSSGIYEGGFKTWECALDLASFLTDTLTDQDEILHVIELGAGSAIPSLVLLRQALTRHKHMDSRRLKVIFTLCDYNYDVLRLATAPNVFLVENCFDSGESSAPSLKTEQIAINVELEDIDETTVSATLSRLEEAGIFVNFVSGAWGRDFDKLTELPPEFRSSGTATTSDAVKTLVLASETIYSPTSLDVFTDTLMTLIRRQPETRALVAAKKVYFGVGGGVQDFESEVHKRGGRVVQVLDINSAGVGRVILEVSAGET